MKIADPFSARFMYLLQYKKLTRIFKSIFELMIQIANKSQFNQPNTKKLMTKRSSVSSSSNSKSEDDKYTSATGWNKAGKHVKNQPSEAQLLNQGSKPFLRNL